MHLNYVFEYVDPEKMIEASAVEALWQHVLDSIEVQHIDPGVTVDKFVSCHVNGGTVRTKIGFILRWYRDNSFPDRVRIPPRIGTLKHTGQVDEWIGYEAAEVYVAGLWAAYCLHDSLELVMRRVADSPCYVNSDQLMTDRRRIVNPHEAGSYQSHLLNNRTDAIPMMEVAVGTQRAWELHGNSRERARQDVINEMEFIRQGRPSYFGT